MSQKVCICGRERSKDKPLLITINACSKKHPLTKNTTSKTNKNDKKPPNKDDYAKITPSGKTKKSTHVLQSTVEQGKPTPISEKNVHSLSRSVQTVGQPSAYRTLESPPELSSEELDNTSRTNGNSKSSSKTSSKSILKVPSSSQKSNNVTVDQGNQSGSPVSGKSVHSVTKTPRTSFEEPSSSGNISLRRHNSSENEVFHSAKNVLSDTESLEETEKAKEEPIMDHILFCEEENLIRIRSRGISEETICGLDGYIEKTITPRSPYKVLEHPRVQMDQNTGPIEPRTMKHKVVSADIDEFLKDKVFNFPSDGNMKLPRLTPRYHGPGCAMEVNILEKHGKKCSYKKQKNPDRNPVDDSAGSYDVIGRIMFKTCGGGSYSNMNDTTGMDKLSNQKLSELYSLLHLPVANKKTFILNASTSDNRVEPVKIFPDAIITSSKSVPNYYHGNVKADGNWRDRRDLEDLYLSNGKADKSIQMNYGHQKKWYHSLFSCFIEKSES